MPWPSPNSLTQRQRRAPPSQRRILKCLLGAYISPFISSLLSPPSPSRSAASTSLLLCVTSPRPGQFCFLLFLTTPVMPHRQLTLKQQAWHQSFLLQFCWISTLNWTVSFLFLLFYFLNKVDINVYAFIVSFSLFINACFLYSYVETCLRGNILLELVLTGIETEGI